MNRDLRIGMLTPSSNSCLEPVTQQAVSLLPGLSVHFTRVPVVALNLGKESVSQFQAEPMVQAARLLADAEVDVIAWNGTSGSWLGLEHDRQIVHAIQTATDTEATTTTLAFFKAFQELEVTQCGLAVPYTAQLTERIKLTYAENGVTCLDDAHLGLESNLAIGRLSPHEIDQLVRDAAKEDVQAVAIVCTNVCGAPQVAFLEARLGIPVLDSVLVTLWECLQLVGRPAPELVHDWGRLFANPSEKGLIR